MEHKDWQQIEALFHEALQLEATERAAYLAGACVGNESLRREVESLVMTFEQERGFMERPALSFGMRILSGELRPSPVGQTIAQYKILRLLGRGGMGEVYLAEDLNLDRLVALKFLAPAFADNEGARERLKREARAIGALEHPNICAVHEIEERDGYSFIVMQYVEGETLDRLIGDEALEPERALALAEQIVSALSAAHSHYIIHRDIKPQNVVVMPDGQAKVLDFGLAKFVRRQQVAGGAGEDASLLSRPGLIVGTVAYMSPEQLRAEELDYRSDIFSFGILLHEMLSGRNPFKRASDADTISSILSSTPPRLASHAGKVFDDIDRIVCKCLEKERAQRYQTTGELLSDIRRLREDDARRPKRRRRRVIKARPRSLAYAAASLMLALALLIGMYAVYFHRPSVQTVAVLPFVNENGDADAEYLSDGLTLTMVDKLSRLPKLRIKTPTALSAYKNRPVDPLRAGRRLKADVTFFGKIRREGESLTLHLQLLDTSSGSLLWEETFTTRAIEILSRQDDIARRVLAGLDLSLDEAEISSLAEQRTRNPEAMRLYLLGRYYWNKRDAENIKTAIKYFEQAIDLDPSFAQAYTGLADSYVMLSTVAFGSLPTQEVMPKARAAARNAITIDNSLSEAHTSLGIVKLKYEWDWPGAEESLKRAIELNPENAVAHHWYAHLLMITGHFDESIRACQTALEVDPLSPSIVVNLGRSYYFARRYDLAVEHLTKTLEETPDDVNALYLLGLAYLQKKMYPNAVEVLEKVSSINRLHAAAALGYAYAKMRRKDDAHRVLKELEELPAEQHVSPQEKAIIYVGLGDKESAFRYLEGAYEEKFATLAYMKVEPLFDDLRSDPRFSSLANRLKLVP
jgi:serine/threonine-protein kinase